MKDIKLIVPSQQFFNMIREIESIFEHSVTPFFIKNNLSLNIKDILNIVNLVDLKDFEKKLLKREKGELKFNSGVINKSAKFSNTSNVLTFHRVRNQIPFVGSFNIEIQKEVSLSVEKNGIDMSLIFNEEAILLRFNSPELDNKVRHQYLSSINIKNDSVLYNFKNRNSSYSNIIIELDLTSKISNDAIINWSESFGNKHSLFVSSLACDCCSSSNGSPSDGKSERIYLECIEKECTLDKSQIDLSSTDVLEHSILVGMVRLENYKLNYVIFEGVSNSYIIKDFSSPQYLKVKPDIYTIKYLATFGEFPDNPVPNNFKLLIEYFNHS